MICAQVLYHALKAQEPTWNLERLEANRGVSGGTAFCDQALGIGGNACLGAGPIRHQFPRATERLDSPRVRQARAGCHFRN